MKRWVLILLSIVLLVWNSANAQTRKNTPWAKLSHSLVALHEQHAAHLTQRPFGAVQARGSPGYVGR